MLFDSIWFSDFQNVECGMFGVEQQTIKWMNEWICFGYLCNNFNDNNNNNNNGYYLTTTTTTKNAKHHNKLNYPPIKLTSPLMMVCWWWWWFVDGLMIENQLTSQSNIPDWLHSSSVYNL